MLDKLMKIATVYKYDAIIFEISTVFLIFCEVFGFANEAKYVWFKCFIVFYDIIIASILLLITIGFFIFLKKES